MTSSSAPWRHGPELLEVTGVVPIELHRHVVDHDAVARWPAAELWRHANTRDGGPVPPDPVDLLTHVCLHFLKGRLVRSEGALGQVRDIAWIAARGSVDWSELEHTARRRGIIERVRAAVAVPDALGLLIDCPLLRRQRPDAAMLRRFIQARVLVDRPCVPLVAGWPAWSELRRSLWWSRVHLGDRPAGELELWPRPAEVVINRRTAARRLVGQIAADPIMTVDDARAGRWLANLV